MIHCCLSFFFFFIHFVMWRRATGWVHQSPFPRQALRLQSTVIDDSSLYTELVTVAAALRHHDDLYYNQATPVIDDAAYDALAAREADILERHPSLLTRIRSEQGGVTATRWRGRVGSSAAGRKARTHAVPMLSLENVYNTEQFVQWLGRVSKRILAAQETQESEEQQESEVSATTEATLEIISEPKLDGLSLSIRYEPDNTTDTSWKLQWAATRGDGKTGTDVTEAVKSIAMIPQEIRAGAIEQSNMTSFQEVRGEVILPLDNWKQNTTNLTNARNAASGILLRKTANPEDEELRSQLEFYAYDLVNGNITEDGNLLRQQLHAMGFSTPEPSLISTLPLSPNASDVNDILQYYDNTFSSQNSSRLQFDGCVHKLRWHRNSVGVSNRAPRWAIAHKFATTVTGTTRLLDVIVQVGRTGVLTPVAVLEPVNLENVTVQRATLHHFGHAQSVFGGTASVGVGTVVTVRRAGDVIPQIIHAVPIVVDSPQQLLDLSSPPVCPACDSPTIQLESSTRCGGVAWECPPRAVAGLQHAFGRDALDIKGLSAARLEQLRNASLLTRPGDLWTLSSDESLRTKWMELDGWGEKSVNKLCDAADLLVEKGVSLNRYLLALNIPLAGAHTTRLLAKIYRTSEAFLEDLRQANFDRLADDSSTTHGIGPLLIASLVDFAGNEANVKAAEDLARRIKILDSPDDDSSTPLAPTSPSSPFHGLSVVFTGTLPNKMKRSEAQELAKRVLGAKSTPTSVSKTTGIVVVGTRGGKKQKQAEEAGIRVMTAEDFLALVDAQK